VSASTSGSPAEGDWLGPAISADGRFVAFVSWTGGRTGVFVRDRQAGTTEVVSVAADGAWANEHSDYPSISADGRFVAFVSFASNLVSGDTNNDRDIFVRDRQTGTTERVSVAADGAPANGGSGSPAISGDGRFVAFQSGATNLVPGSTHGGIYVRDRLTSTTERVSDGGSESVAISADGRFVAFASGQVLVRDRQLGTTERVSVSTGGEGANGGSRFPSISGDGRFVAFESWASDLVPGDTNGRRDVFVVERE
jgi:Tol biopolymer transport system component